MSRTPPFVDHEYWTVDLNQLFREAIPLAALIGLFAVLALIPLGLSIYLGVLPLLFAVVAQFVLAVGGAIVLLYVVARGIQLAEE